jgi:hypothetical protein
MLCLLPCPSDVVANTVAVDGISAECAPSGTATDGSDVERVPVNEEAGEVAKPGSCCGGVVVEFRVP